MSWQAIFWILVLVCFFLFGFALPMINLWLDEKERPMKVPSKKHVDSFRRCTAAHFEHGKGTDLRTLPPCIWCPDCKEWLRPDDFRETVCFG